jgi:hypothetical protein
VQVQVCSSGHIRGKDGIVGVSRLGPDAPEWVTEDSSRGLHWSHALALALLTAQRMVHASQWCGTITKHCAELLCFSFLAKTFAARASGMPQFHFSVVLVTVCCHAGSSGVDLWGWLFLRVHMHVFFRHVTNV